MRVQTAEDDADRWVQGGAAGERGVIRGGGGAAVEWVGAADEGEGEGAEFGFYA